MGFIWAGKVYLRERRLEKGLPIAFMRWPPITWYLDDFFVVKFLRPLCVLDLEPFLPTFIFLAIASCLSAYSLYRIFNCTIKYVLY